MAWQAGGGRRRPRDPPGGRRPCGAGLLTAFVLCSSFLLAQGQIGKTSFYEITISVNPRETLEGRTVNLSITHEGSNFAVCNWYRETDTKENLIVTLYLPPIIGNTTGPFYTGRQVAGYGCSLLLQNLNVNDSGNYMVTMKGPSVDGHGVVNIEVLGAVLKVTVTGPSHVVESHPVTFRCSSLGFNVSYSWLKGGQPIEAGGKVLVEDNNKTLKLLSTSRSDATTYTCFGQNTFSANSSDPHRLEIFYGPEHPVISPLQQVYNERSTLNLFCSAVSNPPAKVFWYFNGEPLERQNDPQLTQRLAMKNAGKYTCKVTNVETGLSNATALEISVREAVNHVSIRDPGKVVENSITHLNCTASGFNVSYYWLKGSQKLQAGGHLSLSGNGQNLSLSRTSRQDSGLYSCCAVNSFSKDSSNYTMNVFYGPDAPVISPTEQFYAEGANVTLSCQADSNPPSKYTWSFKNSRHSGGIYQLFRLSSADNGTYTCEATNNETKLAQSKIQPICVLEPLSQPVLWASENVVAMDANVTLNCSTSNSSSVDVTWSKDSQPFPTNVEFDYENRILTLFKFQPPDAGTYTCTAQHRFDKATSNPCKLTLAYEAQPQLRMSPGAIAGTTIGSLAGLALCAIVVYFLLTKVSCWVKKTYNIQH
ncbi:cell adhesion molecule CEACAM5-like isoform X2 [Erythrolamprus reginae]|uniref:cell adhesion molecule CEACAM5-like isoform X2 n=1 Tax=Erythrolamprus reginae TaxID=121349 RepID=UPI00396CE0DE